MRVKSKQTHNLLCKREWIRCGSHSNSSTFSRERVREGWYCVDGKKGVEKETENERGGQAWRNMTKRERRELAGKYACPARVLHLLLISKTCISLELRTWLSFHSFFLLFLSFSLSHPPSCLVVLFTFSLSPNSGSVTIARGGNNFRLNYRRKRERGEKRNNVKSSNTHTFHLLLSSITTQTDGKWKCGMCLPFQVGGFWRWMKERGIEVDSWLIWKIEWKKNQDQRWRLSSTLRNHFLSLNGNEDKTPLSVVVSLQDRGQPRSLSLFSFSLSLWLFRQLCYTQAIIIIIISMPTSFQEWKDKLTVYA